MIYFYILISFFSFNSLSNENKKLFEKVEIKSENTQKFNTYLDSIKILTKSQLNINSKSFEFDTIKLEFSEKEKFTLALVDTIKEYFDMLCLKYNVLETKISQIEGGRK